MNVIGEISIDFDLSKFNLSKLVEQFPIAAQRALRIVAMELLRDSRLYVPVLTGKLRDSGRVEDLPSLQDSMRVVRVVYGSDVVRYARRQHEEPMRHPGLGFFGAAKFLEKPLMANWAFYQALFAAEFELALSEKV